jgi:hypothetical protein
MPFESTDLRRIAFDKMSSVLGRDRATRLMERLLSELALELDTPQDLLRFADAMSRLGGFEGALGAMLGVTAVIRGAQPGIE